MYHGSIVKTSCRDKVFVWTDEAAILIVVSCKVEAENIFVLYACALCDILDECLFVAVIEAEEWKNVVLHGNLWSVVHFS